MFDRGAARDATSAFPLDPHQDRAFAGFARAVPFQMVQPFVESGWAVSGACCVAAAVPCPAAWAAPVYVWPTFTVTTVEMACLKINCSWLLVSRMSEYLSKLLMRPESFTPLSRYSVIAVLSLRALLRKLSWIFCAGLSIVSPIYGRAGTPSGAVRLSIVHPNAQRYTQTMGYRTAGYCVSKEAWRAGCAAGRI